MRFGISTIITDEGIRPDGLAKALEERGFDALVVAEHSHVPVSRATPYPAGGELPHEYYRVCDPVVALTAAAVTTSELVIGTGVLLLAQRDTIQTAKEVASVDHISDGRVLLGLGLGWNLEEIADHGVDPATRGKLLDEKLAAMKELWTKEEAEFHGDYVDFDTTFCWPKPLQKRYPPIYFGGSTAATVSRARRHQAGWTPMAVPLERVPAQMSLLDGATDISVDVVVPEDAEPALLDAYRHHGVERALFLLSTRPEPEASNFSTGLPHSSTRTGDRLGEKGRLTERGRMVRVENSPRRSAIVDVLVSAADGLGVSPGQTAIAWLLERARRSSTGVVPIVGPRTLAQVQSYLAAVDVSIGDDVYQRLDDVSRIDLGEPHASLQAEGDKALGGDRKTIRLHPVPTV